MGPESRSARGHVGRSRSLPTDSSGESSLAWASISYAVYAPQSPKESGPTPIRKRSRAPRASYCHGTQRMAG
jgi:hypothetical protein